MTDRFSDNTSIVLEKKKTLYGDLIHLVDFRHLVQGKQLLRLPRPKRDLPEKERICFLGSNLFSFQSRPFSKGDNISLL